MSNIPSPPCSHYDFEKFEWALKLKNWDITVEGRFTRFHTDEDNFPEDGVTPKFYPMDTNEQFAFVPSKYWKEWDGNLDFEVEEIPEYVVLFSVHDIDSLSIVTRGFKSWEEWTSRKAQPLV